jgi:hypothetical protein
MKTDGRIVSEIYLDHDSKAPKFSSFNTSNDGAISTGTCIFNKIYVNHVCMEV